MTKDRAERVDVGNKRSTNESLACGVIRSLRSAVIHRYLSFWYRSNIMTAARPNDRRQPY